MKSIGKEDEYTEFKASTAELQKSLDSVCAILNKHQQGILYFGIKNDGTPVGQIITENTIRDVSRVLTDNIEPRIYPTVNKVFLNDKECIKVEFKGDDVPYFSYGRAFMRVGDEDKKLTQKQLKDLIIKNDEKINKWEDKTSNVTLDDIDEDTIKEFIKNGKKKGRIAFNYTSKKEILKKLNLLDEKGKIKNAGYVLFGKSPTIQLRAAIFATTTKTTFIDMQDFSGNIFKLIEDGEKYISKNIRWSVNFNTGSLSRREIPEIPIRAIRELLCNSFCHRAWNEPYDNYLAIYKDRIEINNPGFFTDEATPEDYIFGEEPSRPRNPLIAQVMYLSGEIERWGSGIKNVYEKCKEDGINLKFENTKTAFSVVIYRKNVEKLIENTNKDLTNKISKSQIDTLNDTLNDTLKLIKNNPYITADDLKDKMKISLSTAKRRIKALQDRGIITRKNGKRDGYWEIVGFDNNIK